MADGAYASNSSTNALHPQPISELSIFEEAPGNVSNIMARAAVDQPYPCFTISHEHGSSLGEWPYMGGCHVHDRRKSIGRIPPR
jgi:hypothetical protein